jgi:hypothetical protein
MVTSLPTRIEKPEQSPAVTESCGATVKFEQLLPPARRKYAAFGVHLHVHANR